jgi:hypothetical protein
MKNAYNLVGNPAGKKPLARHRYILEDNIKRYFKETVCEDVDWIQLD